MKMKMTPVKWYLLALALLLALTVSVAWRQRGINAIPRNNIFTKVQLSNGDWRSYITTMYKIYSIPLQDSAYVIINYEGVTTVPVSKIVAITTFVEAQ